MNWEGCSVFTHTKLQEVWLCIFLCVFRLESHSGALMRVSFQFKALICMCEMYCSGVKCSVVASVVSSWRIVRWGVLRKTYQRKERIWTSLRIEILVCMATTGILLSSLLLFGPLFSLPSFSFCSPFCPLQIMERGWALTPHAV